MATSSFLKLPAEIRTEIYRYLFQDAFLQVTRAARPSNEGDTSIFPAYDAAILQVCQSVAAEARPILASAMSIYFEEGRTPDAFSANWRAKYLAHVQQIVVNHGEGAGFDLKPFSSLKTLRITVEEYGSVHDLRILISSKDEWNKFVAGQYDLKLMEEARKRHLEETDCWLAQLHSDPQRSYGLQSDIHGEVIRPNRRPSSRWPSFVIVYDLVNLKVIRKEESHYSWD